MRLVFMVSQEAVRTGLRAAGMDLEPAVRRRHGVAPADGPESEEHFRATRTYDLGG
jgi:hypothetical protein